MHPMPQIQGAGDTFNVSQRSIDSELPKHILNVDPLQASFNKVFSGWREVEVPVKMEYLGKVKWKTELKVVIDRYSRIVNESGSNYLLNAVMPLIMPAASTSHVKPIDIYNHWNGGLLTIETALLNSYYLPSYICTESYDTDPKGDDDIGIFMQGSGCTFITSNAVLLREHQGNEGHSSYIKVTNPYELNIERYPEIITKLANLAIVTMKAKEGFTMKEIMENYINTTMMRQGMQQQPQQPQGFNPIRAMMGR